MYMPFHIQVPMKHFTQNPAILLESMNIHMQYSGALLKLLLV